MKETALPPASTPATRAAGSLVEYLLDAWQRPILTWDVLREVAQVRREDAKKAIA